MRRVPFYGDLYELRVLLEKVVSTLCSRSRFERVLYVWKKARNVDDVRTVRTRKKILCKSAFSPNAERSDGSLFHETMWLRDDHAWLKPIEKYEALKSSRVSELYGFNERTRNIMAPEPL